MVDSRREREDANVDDDPIFCAVAPFYFLTTLFLNEEKKRLKTINSHRGNDP